jgi:flagellar motor switch protein FliM
VKPDHAFIAERPAAQHCAELLRRGPEPLELLPMLERLGERLAKLLAVALAPLCGGEPPSITALPPRELGAAELIDQIGPLAANTLMWVGAQDAPLLTSVEAKAVLRLVDRAFGGRGEVVSPLPQAFPISAELMMVRIEQLIVQRLGQAMGADAAEAVRAIRRDASLIELAPFTAAPRLAVMVLEVVEGVRAPWTITLALPFSTLAGLFGHGERTPAAHGPGIRAANPAAEPFAGVALPLSAMLVDMNISMAAIAALEPGQILPVAVARNVPLRIGSKTVAHGSIGSQDDRIAIQIIQLA